MNVDLRSPLPQGHQVPFDMFPCTQDNCRERHDFWIGFDLMLADDYFHGRYPDVPWQSKRVVVGDRRQVAARDIDEYPTEPASDNYLASLSLTNQ